MALFLDDILIGVVIALLALLAAISVTGYVLYFEEIITTEKPSDPALKNEMTLQNELQDERHAQWQDQFEDPTPFFNNMAGDPLFINDERFRR